MGRELRRSLSTEACYAIYTCTNEPCYVGEFMQIHGSILPFTQQGLEKKNDVITKSYFRSICHQGETALRQILEKQNRIEHLESSVVKKSW